MTCLTDQRGQKKKSSPEPFWALKDAKQERETVKSLFGHAKRHEKKD
jgi:hypothetical protein